MRTEKSPLRMACRASSNSARESGSDMPLVFGFGTRRPERDADPGSRSLIICPPQASADSQARRDCQNRASAKFEIKRQRDGARKWNLLCSARLTQVRSLGMVPSGSQFFRAEDQFFRAEEKIRGRFWATVICLPERSAGRAVSPQIQGE